METISIIKILISLLGGLSLFIYGINILGSSLEKLSNGLIEKILESLTSNIIKSILLGAMVTAVVQSSGATIIVVVALVNAGIMKFSSAVGVIMGANIGNTITCQILRLCDLEGNENVSDFLLLLSPTYLAPILAIIGIIIFMTAKKSSVKNLGEIFLAGGLLFSGMLVMTTAISPLFELEGFKQFFILPSNPIAGLLIGMLLTIVLQSSSASIGVLQAISTTGLLTFAGVFPIIMGNIIGTCSTPLIASIGANKNAKRTAMIHLYFNFIGTFIFLIVVYLFEYIVGFSFWNEPIGMGGIANFNTLFNIIITVIFIPFHSVLEKLAMITIREKNSSDDEISKAIYLEERFLKSPTLAIEQVMNTVAKMGKLAQGNFLDAVNMLSEYDNKTVELIKEREVILDETEEKVNAYLVAISDGELAETENRSVSLLLHLVSEFESIGDYSLNILKNAIDMNEKSITFSAEAKTELKNLTLAVSEIIELSINAVIYKDKKTIGSIEPLEETIDQIHEILKSRHIERIKNYQCSIAKGIAFIDILTNLGRISDHCSNIAIYIFANLMEKENINHHEYIQKLHKSENEEYKSSYELFQRKYQG